MSALRLSGGRRFSVSACAGGSLLLFWLTLAFWVASYGLPAEARPAPGDSGVVQHTLHHALLLSPPRPARREVRVDAIDLQPGDIVLASHAGNPYGYYAHVTAVIGNGETLGHHVGYGIYAMPFTDHRGYDEVLVMRASLTPWQRREVAAFLRSLVGARFHVLAPKLDARWWNCAKSVWSAYRRVGIDLAPDRDIIVPDDIAASPALGLIRKWTGS